VDKTGDINADRLAPNWRF